MTKTFEITGRDPVTGHALVVIVDDNHIRAIRPAPGEPEAYLSAGLIDLQVNGYGGIDLNGPEVTPNDVRQLCEKLWSLGATTFLPTLITASRERIIAGLKSIAEARRRDWRIAATIPFVHVEGPSISPEDGPRGAHPRAHVRPPDLREFEDWQAASGGLVGMITIAPEHEGALDYIRSVASKGVIVALGHTAASPERIHAAAGAGASLSTHLGNGVAAILPRHPNVLWSQLADDRLAAAFIADGHHLPADAFKAMLRAKGQERSILVSDTVALAGMPPGRYEQPVGGTVEVGADGRICVAGTPYLAGAGLPLSEDVATAAEMAELPLAEALKLATENPGRLVGGRGRLAIGARADLMLFRWQAGQSSLAIDRVWLAGQEVFAR